MYRYIVFAIGVIAGVLGGCSRSETTVLLNWTGDRPFSGDSVAAAFTEVLGDAPDSLQRCSNKRLRIAFVNRPGAFPISGQMNGNTFVQSGPGPGIERNLVRSIAYASSEPLQRFGFDTIVVTLTRSSPNAGSQRASYQVARLDMLSAPDVFSSYSVPVTPVSLVEEPCGITSK